MSFQDLTDGLSHERFMERVSDESRKKARDIQEILHSMNTKTLLCS